MHLGSAAFVSKTKNRKSRSMEDTVTWGGGMTRKHRANPTPGPVC